MRAKALQEPHIRLVARADGIEREIVETIVIAIVAKRGCALGEVAEIGFVLLVENSILGRKALGKRLNVLGKSETDSAEQEGKG